MSFDRTPSGTPPNERAFCTETSFENEGPVGISWVKQELDDAAVVKAVKPGSAAEQVAGLVPGLVLTSVNGVAVIGLPYIDQIDMIRESERPLVLAFDKCHLQNQVRRRAICWHLLLAACCFLLAACCLLLAAYLSLLANGRLVNLLVLTCKTCWYIRSCGASRT